MTPLAPKYKQILWMNVVLLAGGVGFMVYRKWGRLDYALGAGAVLAVVEYAVMYMSLVRKQKKDKGGS